MNQNDPNISVRSRRETSKQKRTLLIVLIVAVIGAVLLWWQKAALIGQFTAQNKPTPASTADKGVSKDSGTPASTANQPVTPSGESASVSPESAKDAPDSPDSIEGAVHDTPWIFTREEICTEDPATMDFFYTRLDQQPYFKAFKLPQSSRDRLTALIQKLAATPPVVTRETDNLLTILKNSAHFFRVIGKDNIDLIKTIIDHEKESFEDVLAALYRLSSQPDCLRDRLGLTIPEPVYYDYSCFFLTTMGGRLYLFRRDSKSRMLVNYYAIQMIDRANDTSTNSHGVDIRPALKSLIEEMESNGNNLKFKESYLDQLYALQEKYPEGTEEQ